MSVPDVDALPAHVWPGSARRLPDGSIEIGGVSLRRLAEEVGTPVYVLDESDVRRRAADFRVAFGEAFAAIGAIVGFAYGPERTLPEVRRTAFAGLRPTWGPDAPHPTAGAAAVGQRPPLVAYNLWLAPGTDLAVARAVARDLRRRYGDTHRIVRAESGEQALDALREIALRGEVVALLLADHVYRDGESGKHVVAGTFNHLEAPSVPVRFTGPVTLFASVLGAAFYVLFADWLSTLWPRWLLLLGLVLIAVSLFMQRGLWGLGERVVASLRRGGRTATTTGERQ